MLYCPKCRSELKIISAAQRGHKWNYRRYPCSRCKITWNWASSKYHDNLIEMKECHLYDLDFEIGDIVRVKRNAPGYSLWYKNKFGKVTKIELNDNGELRYFVTFTGEPLLPFGEWELTRRKERTQ